MRSRTKEPENEMMVLTSSLRRNVTGLMMVASIAIGAAVGATAFPANQHAKSTTEVKCPALPAARR